MDAPTVSVIIPTYNRAHLIGQSIESVLRQTFQDFEIIVVDDDSTDDTEAVVAAYGGRVRYVRTSHGGCGHARNVGMEQARGRYFAFLDSDDLFYPYALELETRLLDSHPAVSMVCAEMTGFDDRGWVKPYHLKDYHRPSFRDPSLTYETIYTASESLGEACEIPAELLRDDPSARERRVYRGNIFDTYLTQIVLCQNTAMLRREAAAEVAPRRETIFNFEEYDYLLGLARDHEVLFVDVPTYKLRYHDVQMSSVAGRDGLYVWIRKQRSLLRVFRRHAFADPLYYARHRSRLDRRMADHYRAAAVPMLLLGRRHGGRRRLSRYRRYARLCLARCGRYGHPERLLLLASYAPHPVRNVLVRLLEGLRLEGVRGLVARIRRRLNRSPAPATA